MYRKCGKRLRGTRISIRETIFMENDMSRYHYDYRGKIKGNIPFSVRLEAQENRSKSSRIKLFPVISESVGVAQATKDF